MQGKRAWGLKYEPWKEAMNDEICALGKNKTWEIEESRRGKELIECKWIYTIKCKAEGTIDRYKVRKLVAKGCTWIYGLEYHETSAKSKKSLLPWTCSCNNWT